MKSFIQCCRVQWLDRPESAAGIAAFFSIRVVDRETLIEEK